MEPMVRLRLKVGPKGQVVIPKVLRERYGIRENDYVLVELREDELAIKRAESVDEVLGWLKARKTGSLARLGELAGVDLEEEFEDEGVR